MARRTLTDLSAWPSLTLEGNLIASAMVARISAPREDDDTRQSYGIRKGLTLREEISTAFRVGQSHFDTFRRLPDPSVEATRRFVRDFLAETFGFIDLAPGPAPLTFLAGDRVPLVIVPPAEDRLDRRSPTLSTERPRSAAFALQDYLNDHDDALWGLVTNGTVLRLMRDNASLTRPAHIEADLAQIFTNEDAASFSVLWLMIHRTRFGCAGTPATDCDLERWRDAGSREGEAARDRLAGQVETALQVLGSGFLEANPDLSAKLASGQVNLTDWFNELLRLVYRLIFLMVAEDRDLLHPSDTAPEARRLYADGYSLAALRAQCVRGSTWDRHHDRFEGVKVVFRALTRGEPDLGLPALGGLFGRDQLPNLDAAKLPNRAFMQALYRLSWLDQKSGVVPVNWRAMETEELGSVYESLLELQPQLAPDGRTLTFAQDTAEQKGNQRKTTGSYYTPDSLVQALLDTALDPVLDRAAAAPDPAAALLSLSVIDPACGSGHFLLAAARRIATRLARIRAEGTPATADFRHALRDVARACIHGVDRNPMAVELTKVALWIETVDPGLPLGFFDAQIRCGDALLGVYDLKALEQGIPDAAYKPLAGDDKDIARLYLKANRDARDGQGTLNYAGGWTMPSPRQRATDYTGFRQLAEDTLEQVEAKRRAFLSYRTSERFHLDEMACNLYVAAFLLPKTGAPPVSRGSRLVPTTEDVWTAMRSGQVWGPLIGRAEVARTARAFHWPLEFPDVFARGGFDVVVGNPPWERIKLQEKEFFAARSPAIATAANKAARDRLIKALQSAAPGTPDRALFDAFEEAKRLAEASSAFVRVPGEEGGRFPLTGTGDVNTYALFAELFSALVGPKGRAGVIVPTGVATDATTAPFFAHLVKDRRLSSLVDFENSRPTFPAVHRSFKFCLLTLGRQEPAARFAFFLTDPAQMAEGERSFTLSPDQIAAINPNTRTAPVFRSRADAELTARIYRAAPVLIEEGKGAQGNLWGVSFMAMFHMSNDSGLFRTAADLAREGFMRDGPNWHRPVIPAQAGTADHLDPRLRGDDSQGGRGTFLPLYEAKMIHQFDHRWAGYDATGESASDLLVAAKADPATEPAPRYWVSEAEVSTRLAAKGWTRGWLMGWRDITNATNERTVIATVFPRTAVGNKIPLMFPTPSPELVAGLVANMAALPFDFASRQKIGGTTLNFFILYQLPILPPDFYTPERLAFVTPRVLELTYTSHSLAPFARDLGHDGPPFPWDETRRAHLRADLDAFYARAYALSRDDLRYILDPADVMGPDYPSETFRVLKEKERHRHGEYRTRRLVLEAWDRMEAGGEFRDMGM